MDNNNLNLHECKCPKSSEINMYGIAVDRCYEDKEKLFVTNNEYANQVNFCPFCGYKAKIQLSKGE